MTGPLKIEEVSGTHESFLTGTNGRQVSTLIHSFLQGSQRTKQ